jgi:CubicO group peptidase (beta-lactamase class C family)
MGLPGLSRRLFIGRTAQAVGTLGSLAVLSACERGVTQPPTGSPGPASGPPITAAAPSPATSQGPAATNRLNLDGFAEFVQGVMRDWNVPATAVAIVKDGQVAFSQGFGKRDLASGADVTAHTIFNIGSCTKAFTTLGLGILADEGKLDWDARVRRYLPDFRLKDPIADELVTLRDMVTHRTGLPGHDRMGLGFATSLKEVVERLPYLDFSREFRTAWQYGSLLYAAAGYAAGQIAGQTWEDFTRQRILKPLGMADSQVSSAGQQGAPDVALPYGVQDPGGKASPKEVPFPNLDAIGPGAAISSSISDLTSWLLLHLSKGKSGSSQIVSESQLEQMHSSQMVASVDAASIEWPSLATYGLGWFIRPYRGQVTHYHDGTTTGFSANVTLVPAARFGIAVLSNLLGTPLPGIVVLNALDRLAGLDQIAWSDRARKEQAAALQAAAKDAAANTPPTSGIRPAHSLQDYTGDFENPGYGTLSILLDGDRLKLKIPRTTVLLEPDGGDVFDITPYSQPGRVSFAPDSAGKIASLAMSLEPKLPEIVFTRKVPDASPSASSIAQLAGTYVTRTGIAVALNSSGRLMLSVPGQAPVELTALQGMRYAVRGATSATVDFKTDASGAVTGIVLNSPSGVLTATRQ